MPQKVRKAIFPVAGLGTRFLPVTKAIPKEIMTLVDRPLIQYAMDEAKEAGIEEFIFVTSRGKGSLEDYFDRAPALEEHLLKKGKLKLLKTIQGTNLESGSIAYVRQHDPLGLGHAVGCARNLIADEPFAVILTDDIFVADEPVLKQMVDAYETVGGEMVALTEVPSDAVSSYGVIEPGPRSGNIIPIKGMVEKPLAGEAPSNFAVIGRYILTPRVMNNIATLGAGSGGEIQLTDAIAQETMNGTTVNGFLFAGQRYDCGSKIGYLKAVVSLALTREDLQDEFRDFLQSVV